jgi:hypothetical protein
LIASNYEVAEQPAQIDGTFLDHSFGLSTTFVMRDRWAPALVGATIVGNLGAESVSVEITPESHARRIYAADGSIGDAGVTLDGRAEEHRAVVDGTIGRQPVTLAATGSTWLPEGVQMLGTWSGQPAIGLLVACTLLYFM